VAGEAETIPNTQSAPKVKVVEVKPAARPARMRRRHWLMVLSFLLMVVGPTAGAGVYLYFYAADQYASRVGFSVRREDTTSAVQFLGSLTNFSGSSSSDTDILYKYIKSQELVAAVDKALDLRKIYGKPKNDPYFSLPKDASIEDLVDYWARVVRLVYDPGTGLIEIEVRAFDPEDARTIANDLLTRSSKMINNLSAVARADVTRYAREDLDVSLTRLKTARQALTRFRNETQIVDPGADIQGQMGLLNSLQAKLAETLIELDLLANTSRDDDPRVEQAKRKIVVIQKRIDEERRKLGVSGPASDTNGYADLVGKFESLQVDLEFAQKAYISALSAYDGAVADARRQSRYLAAYLRPTLAETPQYPRRAIQLTVIALILFGSWTILTLVYYSLRDRR
tara:strand:- start:4241 stop:5431 length:1191 start_codon:yes stop_codon:yes gene_type:complete